MINGWPPRLPQWVQRCLPKPRIGRSGHNESSKEPAKHQLERTYLSPETRITPEWSATVYQVRPEDV